jgi:hypothetical protein
MSDVILIPQGSAYTFRAGPFISLSDAKTRVTNATINQADRRISKAGAAYAQSATAGALTHEANGMYPCTLDAADVNTLGALELDIDVANCFAVKHKFQVVTVDTYNALNGSGNGLRANVMSINSVSSAAIRLALSAGSIIPITVDSSAFTPTPTEFEVSDFSQAGADQLKGRSIVFLSGAMIHQATDIEAYSVVGGKAHFTVTALNAAPANGVTAIIV